MFCQAGRGSGGNPGNLRNKQVPPTRKVLRKPCASHRSKKVVKTIAKQAAKRTSAKCFSERTLPPRASVQWRPKEGLLVYPSWPYMTKWLEEIDLDKGRMSQKKSPLNPGAEVSMVRAALGTLSWRATQSAPQFLADVSLLLSEVGRTSWSEK